MIDMKLHLFKQIGDSRGSYNAPILHAFTTDKVLAKEFKETRDMDNFIHTVIEVDRFEYNQFSKNYPGKVLTRTILNTKDEHGGLEKVSVTMTFSEEEQSVAYDTLISLYPECSTEAKWNFLKYLDDKYNVTRLSLQRTVDRIYETSPRDYVFYGIMAASANDKFSQFIRRR